MIHTDRGRLFLGIGVALVLHLGLFVGLAVAGLDFTPYPETTPVFVTLPDYETPPEATEPEAVDPQPEEIEPEPEPVEPEPSELPEEPAPEEATPDQPDSAQPTADPEPTSEQTPEPAVRPEPGTQPEAAGEPATGGRDAPEGAFGTEDLPWLSDESAERERTRDEDLFALDEPDETVTDLPSWVVQGEFSRRPESTLDEEERETLERKRQTVPGFDERLEELMAALENPSRPAPGPSGDEAGEGQSGTTGPGDTPTRLPGGGMIEWVGTGTRGLVGEPPMPDLTAEDFGGEVPARIIYLVVFEVNEDGLIVPGSLILRQSSGYTRADVKVRRAVSSWRFDPAPGAEPVTAIATLHIARDRIR